MNDNDPRLQVDIDWGLAVDLYFNACRNFVGGHGQERHIVEVRLNGGFGDLATFQRSHAGGSCNWVDRQGLLYTSSQLTFAIDPVEYVYNNAAMLYRELNVSYTYTSTTSASGIYGS